MNKTELLDYAIKGVGVEIAEVETKIRKGYNIITQIDKGEKQTEKSRAEILETIESFKIQRDELRKKRDDLMFEYMMVDIDEQTERREESVIKVALSSILSKDTENLGSLFIDEMVKILDKMILKPYCQRIGKRYDLLTDEDKQIIADMQAEDYIKIGEQRAREIEQGENEDE